MTTSRESHRFFNSYSKPLSEPKNLFSNQQAVNSNQRYSIMSRASTLDNLQNPLFVRGPLINSEPTFEQRNLYFTSVTPTPGGPSMYNNQFDPFVSNKRKSYPRHDTPFQPLQMRSNNQFPRTFEEERVNMSANSTKSSLMSPNMFNSSMMTRNLSQKMIVNRGYAPQGMIYPNNFSQNIIMANMVRFKNAYQRQIIEKARETQKKQEEQERIDMLDRLTRQLETQCEVLRDLFVSSNENPREVERPKNSTRNSLSRMRRRMVNGNEEIPSRLSSTYQSHRTTDGRMIRKESQESLNEQDWTESQLEQSGVLSQEDISYEQEIERNSSYSNKRYVTSLEDLSHTRSYNNIKSPLHDYYPGRENYNYYSHQEIGRMEYNQAGVHNDEKESCPSIQGDLLDESYSEDEEEPKDALSRTQSETYRSGRRLFDYSRKQNEKDDSQLSLPSLTRLEKEYERSISTARPSEKSQSKSAVLDDAAPSPSSTKHKSLIFKRIEVMKQRGKLTGLNNEDSNYPGPSRVDENQTAQDRDRTENKDDMTLQLLNEAQTEEPIKSADATQDDSKSHNLQVKRKKSKKGKKKKANKQLEGKENMFSTLEVENGARPLQRTEKIIAPRRVSLMPKEDALPEIQEETEQTQIISGQWEAPQRNETTNAENEEEAITPINRPIEDYSLQQGNKFSKIKSVPLEKRNYENFADVRLPQSRLFGKQGTEKSKPTDNLELYANEERHMRKKSPLKVNEQKKSLFNYVTKR